MNLNADCRILKTNRIGNEHVRPSQPVNLNGRVKPSVVKQLRRTGAGAGKAIQWNIERHWLR